MGVGIFPGIASAATPGAQLWAKRFDDVADGYDAASALAVSPASSEVFVTGSAYAGDLDYVTVAYDASSGTKIWLMRYKGSGGGNDSAEAIGVSPDGSEVFVTGVSLGTSGFNDFATVAYDASTGAQLWVARYRGPTETYNVAVALAVSPDGSKVFVTGESFTSAAVPDYATVSYDASSGTETWSKLYNGTGNGSDSATALAVSPDGSELFVTGGSLGHSGSFDYATVAYDASTGKRLWTKRYRGPSKRADFATALGVSPDGSEVFVTGRSRVTGSNYDYVTVAYGASDGAQLWARGYNGPPNRPDLATALGVSPDGSEVFVTGRSRGATSFDDYATVAYDAATGAEMWVTRYSGPGHGADVAVALGVSPDGSEVFVTGRSAGATSSYDYATVAHDATTGAQLWVARYNGSGNSSDTAVSLGISPDGSEVFVTGISVGSTSREDYATVAYGVG